MPVIEVFSDIWCPFSHVGLRAVIRRRGEQGRTDVAIRARAWPLELVNGEPLDADQTASHIQELRDSVAPDLFVGFDPERFPTSTLPALALAEEAYRWSDAVGETVSLALRDALFEDGLDISSMDVLASIVERFNLEAPSDDDLECVLADWHRGERRGAKGSPHFFCGNRDVFCPSLEITRDEEGRLLVNRNLEALHGFLETCFAS